MKRQFMHMQPSQGKETPGYAQSNASPQPETTPPYPKKNGSGLLSGYNAAVNNGQRPQASLSPHLLAQLVSHHALHRSLEQKLENSIPPHRPFIKGSKQPFRFTCSNTQFTETCPATTQLICSFQCATATCPATVSSHASPDSPSAEF